LALPTIAFDTPVAREYLGANGLFAHRGDVESLADKLQAGLALSLETPTTGEQTAREQTLGQRLRQRAIQQFEWKKAGQTIVEAYEKLVTKAGEKSLKRAWVVTQK
jgi:glycosyltransferase involved in cell wall biosynthesis